MYLRLVVLCSSQEIRTSFSSLIYPGNIKICRNLKNYDVLDGGDVEGGLAGSSFDAVLGQVEGHEVC